jgi:predicted nuclease with RNAse H fold
VDFVGIDVGGKRKGFDIAYGINANGSLSIRLPLGREGTPYRVTAWLNQMGAQPDVIAVDSPIGPAAAGCLSRPCEVALVRAKVCGIRYTPNRARMLEKARWARTQRRSNYYEWIFNGSWLYRVLARHFPRAQVIECFPTASWSRIDGRRRNPRIDKTREAWSSRVLHDLVVLGAPSRA